MNFGLGNVKISTLDDTEIQSISDMEMKIESDQDFYYSFLKPSEELSAAIETKLPSDLLNELEKTATESNFILGCDYGDGESKEVCFKAKLKHEITNIRKVRKGKRWIRKFNYTGYVLMEGVMINE